MLGTFDPRLKPQPPRFYDRLALHCKHTTEKRCPPNRLGTGGKHLPQIIPSASLDGSRPNTEHAVRPAVLAVGANHRGSYVCDAAVLDVLMKACVIEVEDHHVQRIDEA